MFWIFDFAFKSIQDTKMSWTLFTFAMCFNPEWIPRKINSLHTVSAKLNVTITISALEDHTFSFCPLLLCQEPVIDVAGTPANVTLSEIWQKQSHTFPKLITSRRSQEVSFESADDSISTKKLYMDNFSHIIMVTRGNYPIWKETDIGDTSIFHGSPIQLTCQPIQLTCPADMARTSPVEPQQ